MYQRVIPDSLTLSSGRRTASTWRNGKEDDDREESNDLVMAKTNSSFESKGISRFRSPSRTSQENHIGNSTINGVDAENPNSSPTSNNNKNHHNHESNGVVKAGGNDNFLQWGHRKRSRCSRGMGALTDETSSSTSNLQPPSKLQRRILPESSSPNSNANAMPPPSQPSTTNNGVSIGPNLRTPTKSNSSSPSPLSRRNLEERSLGGNKSPSPAPRSSSRGVSSRSRIGKKLPSLDEKSPRDEKMNNGGGSSSVLQQQQQHQEAAGGGGGINDDSNNGGRPGKVVAGGGGGGGGNEVNEWPRIYIPLSRKEKEEDFLAMKGTKLPHRPKKRSKTVDRMLQYCFPGMWLPELTRGRYEVREKKCPKKQKRRGLKGMESLDSDSE